MRRWLPWVLLVMVCAGVWLAGTRQPASRPAGPGPAVEPHEPPSAQAQARESVPTAAERSAPLPGSLPAEVTDTIALIQRGGPFPHRQDGGAFGNREGRLPRQPRGWYREYTVATPGLPHRGARRIVTGGAPPSEWFYTDDHYDSFRRFEPSAAGQGGDAHE